MPQSTENPLVTVFIDVFAYVMLLKSHCVVEQPTVEEVKEKLNDIIEDSAKKMLNYQIDLRQFDDARFAVVAWVDETLLNMAWSSRDQWRQYLLQTQYYNTMNAGSEFYEKLNQIHQDDSNVREIYYLCFGLGFEGRYSKKDDEVLLQQLRKSNLQALKRTMPGMSADISSYSGKKLFRKAYLDHSTSIDYKRRTNWRYLFALGVPPLLVIALYFIYSFVLNDVAENIMRHIMED